MRTTPSSNGGSSKRIKLDTKTVDRLQNRVLMYGAIYIIMKITNLVTIVYEYTSRWKWLSQSFPNEEPFIYIILLRIATSQLVGVLCILWICRASAFKSWQNCCKGCLCSQKTKRTDPPIPSAFPQVAYHQQSQVEGAAVSIQQPMYNEIHGNI